MRVAKIPANQHPGNTNPIATTLIACCAGTLVSPVKTTVNTNDPLAVLEEVWTVSVFVAWLKAHCMPAGAFRHFPVTVPVSPLNCAMTVAF